MWNREFDRYASSHRAVRFDLRGFGESSAARGPFSYVEDIDTLVSHLDLHRFFLVGSSMGGAFALDYALRHPERVRGLLLAAPGLSGGLEPPFAPEEEAAFEYDTKRSREIVEAHSRGDATLAFERLRALRCSALTGPNLELFRTMVDENEFEVFEDRSGKRATSGPPAAGRLGEIRAPTTVLFGVRDNPSSRVFADRIVRSVSGARLVTIPGADHLVNLSRPDAFDAALTSALDALE
jgi:pimeloyl-ACP methyl ester carboxylesterase